MKNFIKKPFLTIVVAVFVVAAILYIESQKPDLSKTVDLINKNTNPSNANTADLINKNTNSSNTNIQNGIINTVKDLKYPKAPNFIAIERWINSEPLKIEQLRGKVVLVDFWTYTCINCIRTLPYLKEWDKKYRDKGLVIVGVHTPEFEFEKKYENVLKAVADYEIKYPVAQDNAYATWNSYENRYWPHEFLIDIDGYIRHDHIGEGSYDETEQMIQTLLQERMERLNQANGVNMSITKPKEAVDFNAYGVGTPEIYFGYQFTRGNLGNVNSNPDEIMDYKIPATASANNVYLQGKWKNNADNIELADDEGSIFLIFKAKNVNIVAGSENASEAFVSLDNDYENEKNKGSDVIISGNQSLAKIKEFKLYNLGFAQNYDVHAISIDVVGKGFKIYTFTFG